MITSKIIGSVQTFFTQATRQQVKFVMKSVMKKMQLNLLLMLQQMCDDEIESRTSRFGKSKAAVMTATELRSIFAKTEALNHD